MRHVRVREEVAGGRAYKERLVREGNAHAAWVFDGEMAHRGALDLIARAGAGNPTRDAKLV